MIATSEPIYDFPLLGESTSGKNWTDLLKILSAETSNVMRFKLSWDPFRAPDEKQVSRYTPSTLGKWAITVITAIHIAATEGHTKVIEELPHASASVDVLDHDHNTALSISIRKQDLDIVKLLLSFGASPNPAQPNQKTYLIFPSIFGLVDVLKALLDAGADPNAADDLPSMLSVTPLHMAAEMGHVNVVEALIGAGANVDARTSLGTTPLLQSAMNGHVDVAKLLLTKGADVNAKQTNGATPRDIAVYKEHKEMGEILQEAGGLRNMFFEDENVGVADDNDTFCAAEEELNLG